MNTVLFHNKHIPLPGKFVVVSRTKVSPTQEDLVIRGDVPDSDKVRSERVTITFHAHTHNAASGMPVGMYVYGNCNVSSKRLMARRKWNYGSQKYEPEAWAKAGEGGVRDTDSIIGDLLNTGPYGWARE